MYSKSGAGPPPRVDGDGADAPRVVRMDLAHEGEVGAQHAREVAGQRTEERLARLLDHALGDLRDERLLAPSVGDVVRGEDDARPAADLEALAGEHERAPPAALHDEGHLEVVHRPVLAQAAHPEVALRRVRPQAEFHRRAPHHLVLRVARHGDEARGHEEDPAVRQPHDRHRVGARAKRPGEELLRLLQALPRRPERLVHQHGRGDVRERGRELLLVGRPLAPLPHRLEAHHAPRLALLPDARVEHGHDPVGAQVVDRVLAGVRIGGGVGSHDGAVVAQGLEIARITARIENLARFVAPLRAQEGVGKRQARAVFRENPDGGPRHLERVAGRLGDRVPCRAGARGGDAALQEGEERRLLDLGPEAGGRGAAVHQRGPSGPAVGREPAAGITPDSPLVAIINPR